MSAQQCVHLEDANQAWRCPDCGLLWEPLPAEPVDRPARPRRSWSEVFDVVSSVATCVVTLALFWWLGQRTIFFAICICLVLTVGGWWVWRRLNS
ncbi:hypothetical protein [Nonomuraea sp. SYSU D8015]|uniref:hypothetical protein n=1 Tax=Nonomuraea sp. SYSU D8015 TaxID=2593644 RepID=UPI001660B65D|nr:hypothetical protein [Nonomuraea sp. SYSU D8015]